MQSRWLEWIERLPIATRRPWIGYAVAVGASLLGLAVREVASPLLPVGYPFVTFFPAVILTAFLFGPRPGVLAGALGWVFARYYYIEPLHSLSLDSAIVAGLLFYGFIVAVDITIIHFMQYANRVVRAQRESSIKRSELREVMFSELQHRVSNKLQIIASLLTLQKRRVTDPDAQKALEDAAARVGMIGRISRTLHDPDRAGLSVAAFLELVGRDIIETAGAHEVMLTVHADSDMEFSGDDGVPIALIIAETISNALEHGFQSRGQGAITIRVQSEAGALLVTVADDGCGVPEGFDAGASHSLGLRIATTLSKQLGGTFALRPVATGGTIAEFRLGMT